MEFNDGNQWHRLTDVDAYRAAGRDLYAYRVASKDKTTNQMYVDRSFDAHRKISAGLKGTLLYQFVYSDLDPQVQANFFCDALGYGLQQQEMVCVDLEVGGGFNGQNINLFTRTWLNAVEAILDTKAWIYVPKSLSTPVGAFAGDRLLWAPLYSGSAARGPAPSWRHDVHQYTDVGPFPGSPDGPADVSYTALTTEAMLARCNPSGFSEPPHGGPR